MGGRGHVRDQQSCGLADPLSGLAHCQFHQLFCPIHQLYLYPVLYQFWHRAAYPPPLVLVTVTNKQIVLIEKYVTTFANVSKHNVRPTTTYQFQTTTVAPQYGSPYPAPLVTNTVIQNVTANIPSGDFFLLSPFYTNYCPLDIVSIGLTNVQKVTNFLASAVTNIVTSTNASTFTSTMVQIGNFTNYTFIVNPVTCTQSGPPTGLYEGIEKIQFVYAPYDSLLGQTFTPVTNNYSMVAVVNSQPVVQKFQRIVTAPDFRLPLWTLETHPS